MNAVRCKTHTPASLSTVQPNAQPNVCGSLFMSLVFESAAAVAAVARMNSLWMNR